MPLHWSMDSDKQLFEVICDGIVAADDVHKMLDVLVGSRALGYRKIFDGSRGDTAMGPLDILNIGVRMRSLHAGVALGPLAVVIPADKYVLLSRVLGVLASPRRPMRIFSDPRKARLWLDSTPVRARAPREDLMAQFRGASSQPVGR